MRKILKEARQEAGIREVYDRHYVRFIVAAVINT